MTKMIHYMLGTEMYVADERVDEYLALGHRLASEPKVVKETPTPAPAKKTARSRKK